MDLDNALLSKAVTALLKHEQKKGAAKSSAALFEDYAKPILLQLQLTSPITREVTRPVRVKIPHSLFSEDGNSSVCFFCRTDDKESFDKLLAEKSVPGLTTVLSMKQVKKEYNAFTDKKKLLSAHTHFLCDPSIVTQLYSTLGSVFSARNKVPVPIRSCSIAKVPSEAIRALNSSYMHLKGDNISIRLGNTSLTADEIVDNVTAGLAFAIEKLPDNWRSIHSIHIKTSDSASLPLYSKAKNDYLTFAKDLAGTSEAKKNTKSDKKAAVAVATPAKAEVPKAKTPAAKTPAAKTPAAKTPAAKTPAAGKAKTPAVKAVEEVAVVAQTSNKAQTSAKKVATPAKASVLEEVSKAETPAAKTPAANAKTPKAKTPAVKVVAEEEVAKAAPVVSAVKGKKTPAKKAAAPEPESEPEEVPQSAKKTPARKAKAAVESTPIQSDSENDDTPKSTKRPTRTRTAVALETVPENEEVAKAAATPARSTRTKRGAAAIEDVSASETESETVGKRLRRGRSESR